MKKSFATFAALLFAGGLLWAQQMPNQSDGQSLPNQSNGVMRYDRSTDSSPDSLLLIEVQQVEVRALRAGSTTPVAQSTMNAEQIRMVNSGRDIPFVLSSLPSVVSTSDAGTGIGYTSIRIRGTDATRINVTANGVPVNDAESHSLYWVNMPDFASSAGDIQVQRGAGTSTNGAGAFGGSIALTTRPLSESSSAALQLGYGSYNTRRATLSLSSGLMSDHWIVDARLSRICSDGYVRRASVDLGSYFAQAGYYNGATMIKFVTFGGREQTYHAWNGIDKATLESDRRYNPCGEIEDADGNVTGFYDDQIDLYRQIHYQLLFSQLLSSRWSMNVTLHATDGYGYYEEYKNSRKLVEYGLQPFAVDGNSVSRSNLIRRKIMDNIFYGGVFSFNYSADNLKLSVGGAANRYSGDHCGQVRWVQNYIGSLDANSEYYRNRGIKTDANLYAKLDWHILPQLWLYADAQYRFVDYSIEGDNDKFDSSKGANQYLNVDRKFHFFNPKAGLYYRLGDRNTLYASVAVAHKEPTRNNFTDAKSDRAPLSERLIDFEVGWNLRSRVLDAGVNLYYMHYRNQLILTGEVNEIGEALASNVSESYRAGVELTASLHIARGLDWNANLTLSRNRIVDYTEYVDSYDDDWNYSQITNNLGNTDISFSPSLTACSVVSYRIAHFDAALQTNYVSRQYLTNSSSKALSLDPYCTTNLTAHYRFDCNRMRKLSVGVALNNIFSAKYCSNGWGYSWYEQGVRYDSAGYFPQAPCNFMVMMDLEF